VDIPARRHRSRWPAALLVVALVLAACGQAAPTASPSPSPASPAPSPSASPGPSTGPSASSGIEALAAEIADQVAELRQLELKEPIPIEVLDQAGLDRFVAESFAEDTPADYAAASDRFLTLLGLLPEDADLTETYLELIGSQVLGLYDEKSDRLYVVSREGEVGPTERVTLAHEIDHAIQDQHFDLGSVVPDALDQGDRALGARSLVEGDASLVMALWAAANLTPAETLQLLEDAQDPEQAALMASMPPILRDTLTFQYEQGLAFALGLRTEGGWDAVDAAFDRPPASTEQVIHPEKYAADEPPVEVALPADLATRLGPGWALDLEDTMGELQLRIWLQTAGDREPGPDEANAAVGWGGDRVGYLAGPDGAEAVVMRVVWDDAASADDFQEVASRIVADTLSRPGAVFRLGDRETLVIVASDGAVLDAAAAAVNVPR
jgi:hypothetical protein